VSTTTTTTTTNNNNNDFSNAHFLTTHSTHARFLFLHNESFLLFFLIVQVQKIIWPECLIRYDDNERVERAKSRIGEKFYGVLENNYEQLVSWCICGLNVSLQVNWWHFFIRDALYTILAGCKSLVVDGIILRIAANVSDEVMGSVVTGASRSTMIIGFAIGAVLETGFAAYQIHKVYTQWKKKSISGEQFKVRLVEIIIKGVFRFGFGVIVVQSICGLRSN